MVSRDSGGSGKAKNDKQTNEQLKYSQEKKTICQRLVTSPSSLPHVFGFRNVSSYVNCDTTQATSDVHAKMAVSLTSVSQLSKYTRRAVVHTCSSHAICLVSEFALHRGELRSASLRSLSNFAIGVVFNSKYGCSSKLQSTTRNLAPRNGALNMSTETRIKTQALRE